jgi:hypothetical protein
MYLISGNGTTYIPSTALVCDRGHFSSHSKKIALLARGL